MQDEFQIGDSVLYYPIKNTRDCYGNITTPPEAIEAEISAIAENNIRVKRFKKRLFGKKRVEVWINGNYFEIKKVKQ